MADLFFNGYKCSVCARPGVRTSRVDILDAAIVDRCGVGSCGGSLIRIPLDQAERELLEALRADRVIRGDVLDDGSLNRVREPEPI